LAGLQTADLQRRMNLARFLWQHRSRESGWSEIQRLADDASGFAEANLWIVRNALSAEPYQQQTAEQLIDRLKRVLRAAPDTAEARGLLAQLYPAVGEKVLGEQHLVQAAEADLAWVDSLAELLAADGRLQPGDSRVLDAVTCCRRNWR
jgi:thioredoxin-like negative regulator of GroEL